MTDMYCVQHKDGYWSSVLETFLAAQSFYFRQQRLSDGSIPWRIVYNEYLIEPGTGKIIGHAE